MTWLEFLDELRADLQATSTSKWSDKLLWVFTKDAIRDYSVWFPRRIDRVELASNGSAYPLPANFLQAIVVECPENRYLERRQETPGRRYHTVTPPSSYFIEGGNLYLNGSPLEKVLLTYFASRDVPETEEDAGFVFDIPDADMELIRLYVMAKIHSQMRSKQSRLDRFDPSSGRRDDNPLTPETDKLMQEYQRKVAERIPGGVIKLFRPGFTR